MTDKIRKIIPVGFKAETEIWIFISAIAVGICRALLFFQAYMREYNRLFDIEYGQRVLKIGRKMTEFYEIIDGTFDGFAIAVFAFIVLILYHYIYHYRDSKSIYTMKRLPDKNELHIRCISVPLAGITLSVILSVSLMLIFYRYYMTKTPAECLFPDQWERLWTQILYGGKIL